MPRDLGGGQAHDVGKREHLGLVGPVTWDAGVQQIRGPRDTAEEDRQVRVEPWAHRRNAERKNALPVPICQSLRSVPMASEVRQTREVRGGKRRREGEERGRREWGG